MLFQSLDFALFLPLALLAYWPLRSRLTLQNVVLAVASGVFYAWGGWRLLLPLAVSVLVAYLTAAAVSRMPEGRGRTAILTAGVVADLALLGYYKYANFFLGAVGGGTLHVLLPVGISFYTFRAISYMVDVARADTVAEGSLINVFGYVSFFPYLLAGPVDRSKTFLPQLLHPRTISRDDIVVASRLILWGLFKKIVIADALGGYVEYVFVKHTELAGSTLIIGLVYYTLQLYADFSGYSDIAVGVARLFGFRITQNFHTPFFARSIAEFWRRWHISLYNWLNDYLYMPLVLALRDFDLAGIVAAVVVTFTLSGLWHGAGWGFVLWGLLHGLYFVPLIVLRRGKGRAVMGGRGATAIQAKDAGWILLTFSCVVFANVFFRSPTLTDAFSYLGHIASPSVLTPPAAGITRLAWVFVLPAFEWIQRDRAHALDIGSWHYTIRYPVYAAIVLAIFVSIRPANSAEYLYFKF